MRKRGGGRKQSTDWKAQTAALKENHAAILPGTGTVDYGTRRIAVGTLRRPTSPATEKTPCMRPKGLQLAGSATQAQARAAKYKSKTLPPAA